MVMEHIPPFTIHICPLNNNPEHMYIYNEHTIPDMEQTDQFLHTAIKISGNAEGTERDRFPFINTLNNPHIRAGRSTVAI
jgi:hypothetical protein